MLCSLKCVAVAALSIGIIIGIGCSVGIPLLTIYLNNKVNQEIQLLPNTTGYQNWLHPGGPIYMQFYIFNIVNPLEVEQGHKPYVEQIGPFTYREYRIKDDIVFYENGTMSYNETQTYKFLPNESIDTENFTFTTVNVPLLSALQIMRKDNISESIKKLFFKFISFVHNEGLFVRRSVKEMVWGYDDAIFDFLRDILPSSFDIPKTFGLRHNPANDGVFHIYTGHNNHANLGKITSWNGQSSLTWWRTKYANMINGTDAQQFHPHLKRTEMLYTFNQDICRSIYAIFYSEVMLKGIPLYRYTVPGKVFLNSSANPDNYGFCRPCLVSGLLSLSSCQKGAPIAISSPHFLYGDPQLLSNVSGLHPNQTEHATWIDIDPITGLTMHAQKRLQINAIVSPDHNLQGMKHVKYVVMPILYLNESAKIDNKHVQQYMDQLGTPLLLFHILEYVVPSVAGFLVLVSVVAFIVIRRRKVSVLYVKLNDDEPASG